MDGAGEREREREKMDTSPRGVEVQFITWHSGAEIQTDAQRTCPPKGTCVGRGSLTCPSPEAVLQDSVCVYV